MAAKERKCSRESSSDYSTAGGKTSQFKVIFVGVQGVGKTSLFLRIRDGKYYGKESQNMTPDFCFKEVTVDTGETVKIQLWDTAGMDHYHSITRSYYLGSEVVLYVYSSDDQESADSLKMYLDDANNHAPGAKKFLIRNKSDLENQSTRKEEVREKLNNKGYYFQYEKNTSALSGDGVDNLIQTVATYLLGHAKPIKNRDTFKAYECYTPKTAKKESGGCC